MPYLGAHRCLINTCGKKPLGGRLSVAPAGGSLLRLLCRPALHRRILVAAKRNINDGTYIVMPVNQPLSSCSLSSLHFLQ